MKELPHFADQFGKTYLCQERKSKKQYMVTFIEKDTLHRIPHKYRKRHLRAMNDDIDILLALKHPNIIKLHSRYEDRHTLYIVMEESMHGSLLDHIFENGRYTEQQSAKIIKQLLSALRYMHQENQVIHCDLRPENILFVNDSIDCPPKILGFGHHWIVKRLTYLQHLSDTPYYIAPEVIKEKKYTHAADVWAIGIILFLLIFGYLPFNCDFIHKERYGPTERKEMYKLIKRGFVARNRSIVKHGFGPWFPDNIPVSRRVRHLISKLLEFKVRNRYTAEEALSHPWILNLGQPDSGNTTTESVKIPLHANICRFKTAVMQFMRQQCEVMTPKDFIQLQQVFESKNIGQTGTVSGQQFKDVVSSVFGTVLLNPQALNKLLSGYLRRFKVGFPMDILGIIERHFKRELFVDLELYDVNYRDLCNALLHDYLVFCDRRLWYV